MNRLPPRPRSANTVHEVFQYRHQDHGSDACVNAIPAGGAVDVHVVTERHGGIGHFTGDGIGTGHGGDGTRYIVSGCRGEKPAIHHHADDFLHGKLGSHGQTNRRDTKLAGGV